MLHAVNLVIAHLFHFKDRVRVWLDRLKKRRQRPAQQDRGLEDHKCQLKDFLGEEGPLHNGETSWEQAEGSTGSIDSYTFIHIATVRPSSAIRVFGEVKHVEREQLPIQSNAAFFRNCKVVSCSKLIFKKAVKLRQNRPCFIKVQSYELSRPMSTGKSSDSILTGCNVSIDGVHAKGSATINDFRFSHL